MDMRHAEYRELRRTRNTRDLRKVRNRMRRAERRAGRRLSPAEAILAHRTYVTVDRLFAAGEAGCFYTFSPGNVFADAEGTIPAQDGDLVLSVRNLVTGETERAFPASAHAPVYREGATGHLEAEGGE